MPILPVMDLLRGQVVRAVAGRRAEYRPIVSRLAASADPVAIAHAFRARLGVEELYIADLDAIGGAAPALPLFRSLAAAGFQLWVDAGLRTEAGAAPLIEAGVSSVV